MAWCPKCKCEYVEGITVCADCECELVEKLPEEGTEPEITQQEALAMMQVMMESGKGIPEELFNIDRSLVRQKLSDLWLDESIMDASGRDDYSHIELIVDRLGKKYIEDEYINERTLKKVIQNMRELYTKIKGK